MNRKYFANNPLKLMKDLEVNIMKRVITVAVVLLLCLSIALPIGANAAIFNSPKAEPMEVQKAQMEGVDVSLNDCVIVTTIEDAKNGNPDITAEEKAALLAAYEALVDGSETLPIEGEYAVREVVDVSFKNEGCRLIPEHGNKDEALKGEGVTLTVDFAMGVEAGAEVAVFTYIDGQWNAIVEATNNGDGSVTCVFEDLCPVAFAVLG